MHNPFSLQNKVILITGASSGIGKQCAISCSQMGATIVLLARDITRLEQTFTEMAPGNHLYYSEDLTEFDKLEGIVADSVNKVGKFSGFIHAAGVELTMPLSNTTTSDFQRIFSLNCIAGFELTKILSKKKYSQPGLSLVLISSIAGCIGNGALSAYSASKGALIAATKSIAIELATKGYRINSVSPGHVKDTKMSNEKALKMSDEVLNTIELSHPLGLGDVYDVANACVYLLSDAAKWVTGINLIVDGGYCAK